MYTEQTDLLHVIKPWGYEVTLGKWGGWRVKMLVVKEYCRTSKQYHREKDEYWFYPGGSVQHIPPGKVHRLEGPIEVLELVRGSDKDVVRLEDDYGRK
jgi:mannose-6-phosphate isomerase-like protein (cupin superfamily)